MKKISKIMLLLTLVGLLGLVFLASCDFTIFGKDEECIHDWDDFRVIERATCTSKGKVERTCKLCGVTEQRETPDFAAHNYGEFVLVEENDCLRTGKAVRTCNICGDEDVTYLLGDHAYGEWIEAKDATLTEDGCLGHYECSVCGKAFDEDKNPIADVVLPKLAPKLSICLDGEPRGEFIASSEHANEITFKISDLEVLAGQRVTICDTENLSNVHEFTVDEKVLSSIGAPILGNIDPEEKMIRTDSKSTVTIIYNIEGGIKLSADGYVHSGVVIEMKNYYTAEPVIFPMEYVSYYGGDKGAYVFGIFGSDSNTSFRIIDLETDIVYDYDDISDSMAWNTWSYSKGKDGSIVFGSDLAEWWVAFSVGGDGKIVLKRMDRAFVRNPALTSGTESIPMEKVDLEVGSDEYKYHTWPLLNGEFYRTELWLNDLSFVDLEDILLYKAVVDVEGGESFDLSIGTELMKAADHICDIRTASGAVSISGNTITFNTAGKYVIEVVAYCAIINIYDYVEETPDPHEHEYVDGKCECGAEDPDYVPDTPDPEGIVIEINGNAFAMNFVTYPSDGVTSYVYGYVYINEGDKVIIRDTESGAVWDYDDISEDLDWNTWDYHRGDNGEIVFDTTSRFGIEFNNDGDNKIYLNKVFPPYDGKSFGIVFPDSEREDIVFDSFDLSLSPELSEEFMWALNHATTMNNDDILTYIEENGLYFGYAMEDFYAGEKFCLKNFTTGELIGAEYMVDIMFGTGAITREGDLVSVLRNGSLYIVYLPAFNSFTVEFHAANESKDVYIYYDGDYVLLTADEDGNVTYENLPATDTSCIMFTDADTNALPIYLDPEMDKSLVDITIYGDCYYAYTKVTGKYNLLYNVNTNTLYLELAEEIVPKGAYMYIGTSSLFHVTADVDGNAIYESIKIGTGVAVHFEDNDKNPLPIVLDESMDNTLVDLVESEGHWEVYFAEEATYNLRYNVNTNELYIEVTEDPIPYDIYIDAYTILPLKENPENPDEMCYLGLEMGAWDEFKVRDSEMNNIRDLTLAPGTAGAETDSRVVIFTEAGTYDIYIHKITHQVRIVSSSGSSGDTSASINDYYIFISVVDYTNGNQTIRMTNDSGKNEAYGRIETMASGSCISVSEMLMSGEYTTTSYGALADTDPSIATSYDSFIMINVAGPVDVYFDFVNKTIKIVPAE